VLVVPALATTAVAGITVDFRRCVDGHGALDQLGGLHVHVREAGTFVTRRAIPAVCFVDTGRQVLGKNGYARGLRAAVIAWHDRRRAALDDPVAKQRIVGLALAVKGCQDAAVVVLDVKFWEVAAVADVALSVVDACLG